MNSINRNIIYFLLLIVILTITFWLVFSFVYPVDYDYLGGYHSYLSGSTIKFVNNWLSEGAWKLKFAMLENFDSIEFDTLSSREPYVSYPSGETLAVWLSAKLFGLSKIDISFLKHFQMTYFLLETIMFASFIYIFLTRITPDFSCIKKSVISYITAVFWMILPVNVWYLCNIFFADQCIIFFVMSFLLVEYIISWEQIGKRGRYILLALRTGIIVFGILIDYYFWILVFVAFVFDFIANLIEKKPKDVVLKSVLLYVLPVFVGLGIFIWQMGYIDNSFDMLLKIFFFRTGSDTGVGTIKELFLRHFSKSFVNGSGIMLGYLAIYSVFLIVSFFIYIIVNKKFKALFINRSLAIVLVNTLAVALQMLILKNHSAVHEFSMMKLAWPLTMTVIYCLILFHKHEKSAQIEFLSGRIKIKPSTIVFAGSVIFLLMITGFPKSASDYCEERLKYDRIDYSLPLLLSEKTDFYDVCVSFDRSIDVNPPQELSVSGKRLYRINTLDDIQKMFPNLPLEANIILVKDKNNSSDNYDIHLNGGNIRYEDDQYCLVELEEIK